MKKILLLLGMVWSYSVQPAELIRIQTPYTASHSGTPAMLRVIEVANQNQKDYSFILEFKPGGNQVIAIKQMDQSPKNSLAVVAASFVENVELGLINPLDYVPVWSLGDACWTVMSTTATSPSIAGLKNNKELVVGTVGFGNATHLTALLIGEKYNIPVKLVPFKSNFDAVVNMTGNNGVTFSIDTPDAYKNFQGRNSKLTMLAVSCSKQLDAYPKIKTLRQQGIHAPSVLNVVVANVEMPLEKRKQLGEILEKSADSIGEAEIEKLSGFSPPQFHKITAQEHFTKSTELISKLRNRFEKEIKQAQ